MNLSEHFTLAEFTASQTATRRGLNNIPSPAMVKKLAWLASRMERVREVLGVPLQINSAYRSASVNRAIGGAATSQHCRGEAVDFIAPQYGDCRAICQAIMSAGIEYDQLIFEGRWVHISFSAQPRKSTLTAHFSNGGVRYTNGIA